MLSLPSLPRSRILTRLGAVLAVCWFSFFTNAAAPELSLMEARNFVAAREMVAGGSWLLPTMNHELRLAKPPLPTWAVAAVQQLTGPTESLALLRLPAALMATLLVLFFWALSHQLTRPFESATLDPGRTAWLAALVLGSSLLVITSGREGQWDIFTNAFLLGALWLLVRGWQSAGPAWAIFAGAGLLLGLSILSKGPVALYGVLLPFLGAYTSGLNAAARPGLRRHRRGTLLAAGVALAVGSSWPLYVFWRVPPAVLAVAQTEVLAWRERHVQPLWYYWNFFAFSGVWAVAALAALAVPYARRRLPALLPYGLVLGWLAAALVLLSLVPEKKERYMLPLLPPLALLASGMLRYWELAFRRYQRATTADRGWLRCWAAALLVAGLALPTALAGAQLPGFEPASRPFALAAGLGASLAAAAAWAGWRLRPHVLTGASLTLMAALLALLLPAHALWQQRRAEPGLRQLTAVRRTSALGQLPWYSLEEPHLKQVWAAGRPIPVWHPATDSLPLQHLPVAVFAAQPVAAQLPVRWRRKIRVEVVDSFYLGSRRQDGRWLVSVLRPR